MLNLKTPCPRHDTYDVGFCLYNEEEEEALTMTAECGSVPRLDVAHAQKMSG